MLRALLRGISNDAPLHLQPLPSVLWLYLRLKIALLAGFAFVLTTGHAEAFQMCPTGTQPCAKVSQMLGYVLAPSLVFLLAVVGSQRCLGRARIRRATVGVLLAVWAVWLVGARAAFAAFLAPCSSTCWYGG